MAKPTGAHEHGPVLSPVEWIPGEGHEPAGECIENGVPGYPKGTERKADEVTFYEGGNFGKFKRG